MKMFLKAKENSERKIYTFRSERHIKRSGIRLMFEKTSQILGTFHYSPDVFHCRERVSIII